MTVQVLFASVLLSVVLVVLARSDSCPEDFTRVGNKCYYVSLEATNWHVADRSCRKLGADLMVFDDEEDQALTTAHLKSLGLTFSDSYRHSVWVGINCLGDRRHFSLSKTGDEIPFQNWVPQQPNNASPEEDCVAFANYNKAYGYHDIECDFDFPFVCERRLSCLCPRQQLFKAEDF
ncbi:C-type lectin 37Db-like [Drosophila madeirensis]|uniref:C-type lectin 37Db-like n=1 Tax=Drosophila madeirensis TaxID=30013 RepID=A0AAU9FKB9_DROMD